jgi:hypothetical protein
MPSVVSWSSYWWFGALSKEMRANQLIGGWMKCKLENKQINDWMREGESAVQGATDSRETGERFRGFERKIVWLWTEGILAWLLPGGWRVVTDWAFTARPSGKRGDLFRLNYIEKFSFDLKISPAPPLGRPAVFCRQAASQLHVLPWISWIQTVNVHFL